MCYKPGYVSSTPLQISNKLGLCGLPFPLHNIWPSERQCSTVQRAAIRRELSAILHKAQITVTALFYTILVLKTCFNQGLLRLAACPAAGGDSLSRGHSIRPTWGRVSLDAQSFSPSRGTGQTGDTYMWDKKCTWSLSAGLRAPVKPPPCRNGGHIPQSKLLHEISFSGSNCSRSAEIAKPASPRDSSGPRDWHGDTEM